MIEVELYTYDLSWSKIGGKFFPLQDMKMYGVVVALATLPPGKESPVLIK